MHDWTLVSILVEWEKALIEIKFLNAAGEVLLTANGFTNIHIPKSNDWGPSVSVNKVIGPVILTNGIMRLEIHIQTGDVIEIEAKSIQMLTGWQA